jgi:SAM-dependent methyltransferase
MNDPVSDPATASLARDQAYYEQSALWAMERFTTAEQQQRFRDIAAVLPLACTTLLDAGCGNGAFLDFLARERPQARACGVDRSRAAIAQGHGTADLRVGDLTALDFPDRAFAAVSALEVLEHIPQPLYARARAEIARVAETWILVDVPFRERRVFNRCPACACHFPDSYHVRSFDTRDFTDLFPGFSLERLVPICPATMGVVPLLYGRLRNRLRPAFRAGALCPLCGYHQAEGGAVTRPAEPGLRQRLLAALRWPAVRWHAEAVAIYHRT